MHGTSKPIVRCVTPAAVATSIDPVKSIAAATSLTPRRLKRGIRTQSPAKLNVNESWRAGIDDGTNDLRDLSQVAHQRGFEIYEPKPQTLYYRPSHCSYL